jgi:P4 family phage/plasmid primase-like protien
MHHWVEAYTAKVSGDEMDPEKGVAKLLEFLLKDCETGKVMPDGWDAGLTDELKAHPTIAALVEIQSAQRWDLGRMVHGLTAAVGDRANDREHVERMIRNIVVSAAQDPLCEEYDLRCLHERIGQIYPETKMKWATLKQLFRENRGGLTAGEELTDHHAVAVAVLDQLTRDGEIRFDQSKFWQWNGSRWQVLDDDDVHLFIAQNVKGCSLAKREGDYAAIVRLLRKVCSSPLKVRALAGVNFANGFYSADGELVPHHPDFGSTYTFPFDYEPGAASQCPEWLNFLSDRWGHEPDFEERVLALQEAFAATLFGSATKYQCAFLLFGKGRSGKSQILNVLQALLPADATACLGPERWGERFPLTHLIGKVANICNELPEQGKINGAMFKQVVDGATVFTEPKNVDGFTFSPACAHWFASNFLPWSQDSTDGFARRWLIWDFNRQVDKNAVETDIASRIVAQERHAIAAWAIEGHARLLQQDGFTEPACHARRLNEMRRGNNSVLAFLQDSRTIVCGEGRIRLEHLHGLYKTHQDAAGGSKVLIDRFRNMVEELGFEVEVGHDGLGYPITTVHGLVLAEPMGLKTAA